MPSANLLPAIAIAICTSLLVPLSASVPDWLTASSRFQPGSHEVAARLTRRIDRLLAVFQPPSGLSSDDFVDQLIAADARAELFRMEAILRLYEHKFPNLSSNLRHVKTMEDGLGAYQYALDSLNFAKDQFKTKNIDDRPRVLDSLEKERVTTHGVLADRITRSTLTSDLTSLRSQIGPHFRGMGTAQDTPFVKRELHQMLTKIRDDPYDFTKLGTGIHEFRRQLRWFPMTIDGLDGLIVVRDDPPGACPAPALESLAGTRAASHKYANPALSHPAADPCTISRCLLWQVSKTIRDFGRLKDAAHGHAAIEALLDDDADRSLDDTASPEDTARATTLRRELNSSHALDLLMSQISSCKV